MNTKVHEMKARKVTVIDKDGNVIDAVAFYDVKSGDDVDPTIFGQYTEEEVKRMTNEAFEHGHSLD